MRSGTADSLSRVRSQDRLDPDTAAAFPVHAAGHGRSSAWFFAPRVTRRPPQRPTRLCPQERRARFGYTSLTLRRTNTCDDLQGVVLGPLYCYLRPGPSRSWRAARSAFRKVSSNSLAAERSRMRLSFRRPTCSDSSRRSRRCCRTRSVDLPATRRCSNEGASSAKLVGAIRVT